LLDSIELSYERDDTDEILNYLFQRHLQLAETMYNCGARRFLLINVPPVSRTPTYLERDKWHREAHEAMVEKFNTRMVIEKTKFQNRFPDVSYGSTELISGSSRLQQNTDLIMLGSHQLYCMTRGHFLQK
jgi:hypothetical protein